MASPAPRSDIVLSVVNKQLEAYNCRDLETFMTLLADDVFVSDGETGKIIATSKEELRPSTVVDREIITGLPDGQEADCLATYVINDKDLIQRITFVWSPRIK